MKKSVNSDILATSNKDTKIVAYSVSRIFHPPNFLCTSEILAKAISIHCLSVKYSVKVCSFFFIFQEKLFSHTISNLFILLGKLSSVQISKYYS